MILPDRYILVTDQISFSRQYSLLLTIISEGLQPIDRIYAYCKMDWILPLLDANILTNHIGYVGSTPQFVKLFRQFPINIIVETNETYHIIYTYFIENNRIIPIWVDTYMNQLISNINSKYTELFPLSEQIRKMQNTETGGTLLEL